VNLPENKEEVSIMNIKLLLVSLIASFAITGSPLFAQEKPEVFVQLGHSGNTRWAGISDREGKVV